MRLSFSSITLLILYFFPEAKIWPCKIGMDSYTKEIEVPLIEISAGLLGGAVDAVAVACEKTNRIKNIAKSLINFGVFMD